MAIEKLCVCLSILLICISVSGESSVVNVKFERMLSGAYSNPNANSDESAAQGLGRLAQKRQRRVEIQQKALQQLYDNVVWPNGANIVYDALWFQNYSRVEGLFSEDVFIKLPPLGEFEGVLANLEYFYGLAGPVQGGLGQATRVTSIEFSSRTCWENSCSFRVVIKFSDFATNSSRSNFTHHGTIFFNERNEICSGEIILTHQAYGDFDAANTTLLTAHRNALCYTLQAQCTGNNTQFPDVASCLSFMSSLPYGGFYHNDRNTTACRTLHLSLQKISPLSQQRHCPHSGPTGGGKCFEKGAAYYYSDKMVNFHRCRDPKW